MTRPRLLSLLLATLALTGCVRRQITLESNPPGALAYLNDQEVGRTPVTREFTWYGRYDVELRKDGYQTVKTTSNVTAPWWQWVPFDLVAELFPVTDRHRFTYTMTPHNPAAADPQRMLNRADNLRDQLQTGVNTKQPATQPAPAPPTPK